MKQGVALGLLGLFGAVVIGAGAVYLWPKGEPAPAPGGHILAPQVTSRSAPPAASQPSAPAAPPAATRSPGVPDFDVVRVRPDGQTVIAGRADPGASVTVLDGDKPVATVTADAKGEWVVVPEKPLAPGSHELSLTEKSPGDGSDRKSANVAVLSVPEPKPGTASQSMAVLLPRQGQGAAKPLQLPPGAPPAGGPASGPAPQIDAVQYDGAGHLSVSGRAAPGERVVLYIDNKPVGETHADANGDWTIKSSETVAAGNYSLRVDAIGADGKVTARAQLRFRRGEVPKELADNQFLVIQHGDTLWHIARRTYGDGLLFTDIYRANRSEIVDPNLIYPGQIVALPPG
jgi:nucleoid-associated protein YgaU